MAFSAPQAKNWHDKDPTTPANAAGMVDLEQRMIAAGQAQVESPGNLGAAYALNLNGCKDGVLVGTLNANSTITVSGLVAGARFRLLLKQDATGGRTVTLSDGGGPPSTLALVLAAAAGATTAVDCFSPDGTSILVEGA